MGKKIKLTEKQLQEFIDSEGSIISGDYDSSDSKIRTNYFRKNKRPQISDDFADETGQNMRWYHYRGFSVTEGDDKLQEDEMKEAIVNKNNSTDVISKNNIEVIPDSSELSKSYEQPQLQNQLDNISSQLTSLGVDEEEEKDIQAIVLKQILSIVEVSKLTPAQQREIKSMVR